MAKAVSLLATFQIALKMCVALNSIQEGKIMNRVFNDYDSRIRPDDAHGENGTKVAVTAYIRLISDISTDAMDMTTQMTFRQRWNDPRLRSSNEGDDGEESIKFINLPSADMVWKPDTFFRNEKWSRVHSDLETNNYMRLFSNGDLLYSTRITLKTTCAMNLRLFPFDTQTCRIQIASYGSTDDEISYDWQDQHPVQMNKNLFVPDFELTQFRTSECDVLTSTGRYSCLELSLTLKRATSQAYLSCYLPMSGLVILSMVVFWMPVETSGSAIARIFMGLSTMLFTIAISLFGYPSAITPNVAYSIAIDQWKAFCSIMTIVALLQTITVQFLKDVQQKETSGDEEIADVSETGLLNTIRRVDKSKLLDWIFRIIFPVAFVAFSVCYFSYYTSEDPPKLDGDVICISNC